MWLLHPVRTKRLNFIGSFRRAVVKCKVHRVFLYGVGGYINTGVKIRIQVLIGGTLRVQGGFNFLCKLLFFTCDLGLQPPIVRQCGFVLGLVNKRSAGGYNYSGYKPPANIKFL